MVNTWLWEWRLGVHYSTFSDKEAFMPHGNGITGQDNPYSTLAGQLELPWQIDLFVPDILLKIEKETLTIFF